MMKTLPGSPLHFFKLVLKGIWVFPRIDFGHLPGPVRAPRHKGLFTYYVSRERGGGVRQMLTIADEGGRHYGLKQAVQLESQSG